MSFAEKGCWGKAEEHFEKAGHLRDKDQWDARTYGRHFIDYFPHRELGIAYYYLAKDFEEEVGEYKELSKEQKKVMEGHYENAVEELKISLSQTPSAKTIFYFNKVYKDLITKNAEIGGDIIEMSFPEIRIDNFRTKDEPVVIAGNVEDETYIKCIYVNDEPVYWLNSLEDFERNLDEKQLARVKKKDFPKDLKTKVSFKKQLLFLPQGDQTVTVKAENIKGGIRTKEIKVQVDRIGPMISVNEIEPLESSDKSKKLVKVSGFLNDESGVSALSVNGVSKFAINEKVVSVKESKTVSFDETIEIDEKDELEIVAYDGLGNETSTRIALADSVVTGSSALFASAGVTDGKNPIFLVQNRPPIRIYLKTDENEYLKKNQEIFTNLFTLRVQVYSDLEGLDSVKVKKIGYETEVDDIFEKYPHIKRMKKAKVISFDYVMDFSSEYKKYVVEAKKGEYISKKIINISPDFIKEGEFDIEKGSYEVLELRNRLSILVFLFEGNYDNAKFLHEKLIEKLEEIKINKYNNLLRLQVIPLEDMSDSFKNNSINSDKNKALEKARDLEKFVLKSEKCGWKNVSLIIIGRIKSGYHKAEDGSIVYRKDTVAKIYHTEVNKDKKIKSLPILNSYLESDLQNLQHTDENILSEMAMILAGKVGVKFPLLVGNIKEIIDEKKDEDLSGREIVTNLSHPDLRPNTILLSYKKRNGSKSGTAIITVSGSETRARLLDRMEAISNEEDNVITE